MPSWCSVPHCSSAKGGHRFPRDKSRCLMWLKAIRREDFAPSHEAVVCKNHFTPEDYTLPKDPTYPNPNLRLKKDAVPNVFSWNAVQRANKRQREKEEKEKETIRRQDIENISKRDIGYVEIEIEGIPKEKGIQCDIDMKKNDLKKNGVSTQSVAKEQETDFTEKNQSLRDRSMRLKNRKAYLANLRCSVPQCNARPTNEISLHPCPNNAAVRNEWADVLRVSYHYVKNMVACSLHFTKIDFTQSKNAERVLKYNAVPSRNLPNRKKVVVQVKHKSLKKVVPSKAFERQKTMTDVDETKESIQEEVTRECRACLKKLDDKKSCCNVFQAWAPPWDGMEATIAEDLAKIANVEISITDRHSKVLCAPCYQMLLDAATFASTVRRSDLLLRMRFTAEIDMEKVWPKPIQVDKNINGSVYNHPMDVEIKQEVVSDEEYPVNATENPYVDTELANLDIKIEPEEFVEPPPMNITINGTISLDPLNSENKDLTNGTEFHQQTEYLEMAVKQEPTSDGEQETEQAPDLPLECLLCTKSFNSVTGLKAHVIAQHSYKTVKRKLDGSVSPEKKRSCNRHICAICKRSFQTSTDLMVHETCHNKHACYGCTEKFDSFELLTRHRKRCNASIANSVQKLKTLEDVKRPLPDVKVEYIKKEIVKEETETTNKDEDIEMKDLNSDQKESKEDQKESVNENVEIDKNKLEYEKKVENVKKLESIIEVVENEKKAKSGIEHVESYNVKVKSEVEHVENEEKKIEGEEISEPDSNMKLHLEIHSRKSDTESTLCDADMSVETLKNDDCT